MDLFEFLLAFFIVVVPVLAVTARLVLKPLVEAILRLREVFASHSADPRLERRVHELEGQLRELRQTVHELKEVEAFHRELLASPSKPTRIQHEEDEEWVASQRA